MPLKWRPTGRPQNTQYSSPLYRKETFSIYFCFSLPSTLWPSVIVLWLDQEMPQNPEGHRPAIWPLGKVQIILEDMNFTMLQSAQCTLYIVYTVYSVYIRRLHIILEDMDHDTVCTVCSVQVVVWSELLRMAIFTETVPRLIQSISFIILNTLAVSLREATTFLKRLRIENWNFNSQITLVSRHQGA